MRNGLLALTLAGLAASGLAQAQTPTQSAPPNKLDLAAVAQAPAAPQTQAAAGAGPAQTDQQGAVAQQAPAATADGQAQTNQEEKRSPPPDRIYFRGEGLLWWTKDIRYPTLVTSGTAGSQGALGTNGTSVLVGGHDLSTDSQSGGRFTLGAFLNEDRTLSVEGNYFILGWASPGTVAAAPPGDFLARPFTDATTGLPGALVVASPGFATGTVTIETQTRLQGGEANGRAVLLHGDCYHVDLLGGFRYLELEDQVGITQATSIVGPVPGGVVGTTALDRFDTRNQFYGGQIGTEVEFGMKGFFVNAHGKVGIGDAHQEATVSGSTTFASNVGIPTTLPTGPFTLPTNIGRYNRDTFCLLPEVGVNAGYYFTHHMRGFVGYSLLYASHFARPGQLIDTTVNPSQIPTPVGSSTLVGPARPSFSFHDSSFWAQGINIGLEFRY